MKKILILGSPGAGKTRLAQQLAQRLQLPLHHLDKLFWKSGWVASDPEEFRHQLQQIMGEEKWIIDGNYGSTLAARLPRADTIIYLDLPTLTCLRGAIERYLRYRNGTRPDMTPGNRERLSLEFLLYILTFRSRKRPGILQKLASLNAEQRRIVLNRRKQVRAFIESL